ncbi:hypothetical protein CONPUDRAFT_58142 [Coniophora puteana RWD-64-598 SS2]|uniref:Methyltransferase domain-containing protein n=1 Tax=Coniophora puteana (strain RWD-64-598) TaxID=741705 RepID=A0A5M3MKD2_CONPW|nr:uncharacterized protein CONPUDRAFT_58142 [Coniophora puteana RWD-64-598 SS2]EIW79526.1 hypothetical protein CONPUDRAFT_58142 [Coniophora puteana RWD-64-598 SS2]
MTSIPPLDDTLYHISPDAAAFFKLSTGIEDDEELKKHILTVREKAYSIVPYPCIRIFTFTHLDMSRLDVYPHVLEIARTKPNAILMDLACCFGGDARKAVADGFPVENVVLSDLKGEFLELGHEMFGTTPETFPAHMLQADVFDPAHLAPSAPATEPVERIANLKDAKTLNDLRGQVSVLHASKLFHLFEEDKQLELAKQLAVLLSAEPGSVICGAQGGHHVKGKRATRTWSTEFEYFCHSPESWDELWNGQVFEKGTVRTDAVLRPYGSLDGELMFLEWSITRL